MHATARLLVILSSTIWTACGSDPSSGGDDNVAATLTGNWKTACFAETDAEGQPSGYKLNELKISGVDLLTTSYFFNSADSNCKAARYSTILTATFRVGGAASGIPGARTIDILPSKTEVTPATAETATVFRAEPYCGISDWQVGVKRDVTGMSCGVAIETNYDVYRLQEPQLVFGYADGDEVGSTPDLRPKTLDIDHAYSRT